MNSGFGALLSITMDFVNAAMPFEAVKMIQAAGIVGGKSGNMYDPQGTATRAEVATIFSRFVDIYINNILDVDAVTANTLVATIQSGSAFDVDA